MKEKRNNSDIYDRGVWRYQYERSLELKNNHNQYPFQYRYLPPMQKPGSNPFFK
ncbi:MAG: hypothetical protein GQ546_08055 [Gammaproteobacteria bacterium]|jgi:hypothetical protein|nr:hypothetical protein [Gammaproteobacteria bacterium]